MKRNTGHGNPKVRTAAAAVNKAPDLHREQLRHLFAPHEEPPRSLRATPPLEMSDICLNPDDLDKSYLNQIDNDIELQKNNYKIINNYLKDSDLPKARQVDILSRAVNSPTDSQLILENLTEVCEKGGGFGFRPNFHW